MVLTRENLSSERDKCVPIKILNMFSFNYNYFQNILRLFDVLRNFSSPQVKQSAIISNKLGIYKLPHEFPNDMTHDT